MNKIINCWKQSEEKIYVAAHRGWSEKFPENTIEAFRAAIELGVDQLETDICISKDGEMMSKSFGYVLTNKYFRCIISIN